MRSAADMDEVGCPEFAAAAERTESTRSCCPSSRHCSYLSIRRSSRSPVPAADDTHLVTASRAVNAGIERVSKEGVRSRRSSPAALNARGRLELYGAIALGGAVGTLARAGLL